MIQARVHHGRVELQGALPEEWEGHFVKIMPLTPDDPQYDLISRLAALHALGPMDLEQEEREQIATALSELNRSSLPRLKFLHGEIP